MEILGKLKVKFVILGFCDPGHQKVYTDFLSHATVSTGSTIEPPDVKYPTIRCSCEQNGYKFTVDEMTLLINERNIAKEKQFSLEEELAFFRDRGRFTLQFAHIRSFMSRIKRSYYKYNYKT